MDLPGHNVAIGFFASALNLDWQAAAGLMHFNNNFYKSDGIKYGNIAVNEIEEKTLIIPGRSRYQLK